MINYPSKYANNSHKEAGLAFIKREVLPNGRFCVMGNLVIEICAYFIKTNFIQEAPILELTIVKKKRKRKENIDFYRISKRKNNEKRLFLPQPKKHTLKIFSPFLIGQ